MLFVTEQKSSMSVLPCATYLCSIFYCISFCFHIGLSVKAVSWGLQNTSGILDCLSEKITLWGADKWMNITDDDICSMDIMHNLAKNNFSPLPPPASNHNLFLAELSSIVACLLFRRILTNIFSTMGLFQYIWYEYVACRWLFEVAIWTFVFFLCDELTHKLSIFPDAASVFAETAVCGCKEWRVGRFTQSASKASG